MTMSICKICGWPPPKYEEDATIYSAGEYCDCCGFMYGLDDRNPKYVRLSRQEWLKTGAKWFRLEERPDDWDLEEQLANIPEAWR